MYIYINRPLPALHLLYVCVMSGACLCYVCVRVLFDFRLFYTYFVLPPVIDVWIRSVWPKALPFEK